VAETGLCWQKNNQTCMTVIETSKITVSSTKDLGISQERRM